KPTTCISSSLKTGISWSCKTDTKTSRSWQRSGSLRLSNILSAFDSKPATLLLSRETPLNTKQTSPFLSSTRPLFSRFRSGKSALLPPPPVSCRLTSATPRGHSPRIGPSKQNHKP
ncbi:unnamed protein product, partial [Ectocarpus sp. 12 AP-2014]